MAVVDYSKYLSVSQSATSSLRYALKDREQNEGGHATGENSEKQRAASVAFSSQTNSEVALTSLTCSHHAPAAWLIQRLDRSHDHDSLCQIYNETSFAREHVADAHRRALHFPSRSRRSRSVVETMTRRAYYAELHQKLLFA
jgi:hypothetical protein